MRLPRDFHGIVMKVQGHRQQMVCIPEGWGSRVFSLIGVPRDGTCPFKREDRQPSAFSCIIYDRALRAVIFLFKSVSYHNQKC